MRPTFLTIVLCCSLIALATALDGSNRKEATDSTTTVQSAEISAMVNNTGSKVGVVPFRDTLFYLSNRIGSHTAEDRARNITKRIRSVYEAPFFYPDSLSLVEDESFTEIIYAPDIVVMSVTEKDAQSASKSRSELAEVNLVSIKNAIVQERELNRASNIGKRMGWILLILSLLFLIIRLINLLFRKLTNYLKNKSVYLHSRLGFLKFLLLSHETFEIYLFKIIGFLRLSLQVIIVLISFPILFSIIPVTRTWTVTLLGWVLNPLNATLSGIWLYLPKLFAIIVIYLVFKYAIRLLQYIFSKISDGTFRFEGFHRDWATPTFSIVRFLLYAFMLVLIFPLLPGSDSDAFKGISVFLGILFSLGSSSVIGNILAGLVITYMRPFQIGDRIKIGEITGDVIEKTSLVTRIRTVKNEDITVPNSSILNSSCINYSANAGKKGKGLIIFTSVTIGYDVQWRLVHETLLKAASRTETILKKPEPFVLQTSLDDFSVAYQLNGYTKEANSQAMVYSTLHQNIQDCCNEAGIEIMSPSYTNLRDGNNTTIPAEYLPGDYKAPPFTVK